LNSNRYIIEKQGGFVNIKNEFLRTDYRFQVRLYIMIPAATAAFRDSAPPRIGRHSRCVASALTASETPFPSLPITRTKRSDTFRRRSKGSPSS
jgi:hypothetical protein